jgi:putative ABC transport system ATP-binding protein
VFGPGWGLDAGSLVATLFLVTLIVGPVTELNEILDQTQSAVAGWRKVLDVLDTPVEVVEPTDGVLLPPGPITLRTDHLSFAYRTGPLVLSDVNLELPPGAHVAVVGETGSGKSTLVRLLTRLADPTEGRILVAGIDLRRVDPVSRQQRIRLVPQDSFLFVATSRWVGSVPVPTTCPQRSPIWTLGGGWINSPSASTRPWVNAATSCRWGNANSWRWPAPNSPTRGC